MKKQFGAVRDRAYPKAMYRGEVQYTDDQIGRAHDAAARVTACTAKIQAGQRRAVLRRLIGRPHHQRLVQRKFGVVPVTTGYIAALFQILWCQQFLVNDLVT